MRTPLETFISPQENHSTNNNDLQGEKTLVQWTTIIFNKDLDLTEENIDMLKKIISVSYDVVGRDKKFLEKHLESTEKDVRRFGECSGKISNYALSHEVYLDEFAFYKKEGDVWHNSKVLFNKIANKVPGLKDIATVQSYYEY